MNAFRGCVVLAAFTLVALVVVHLRAEQTRCMARTLRMESKCYELRHDLWSVQSQVSRLRAPASLHTRLRWFDVGVVPPGESQKTSRVQRLALHER